MGQFVLQALFPARRGADGWELQNTAMGRFGVSTQYQAGHQLALGEIMAAARRTVIGQAPSAQLRGQSRHAFDGQNRLRFITHAILDVSTTQPFNKDFNRAVFGDIPKRPADWD